MALAGGGTSLTGVRQTLQTAAFCAFSTAAFSLATTSLSCGTDHAHYMKFKLAVIVYRGITAQHLGICLICYTAFQTSP